MITQQGATKLFDLLRSQAKLYVGLSYSKPNMDGTGLREPTAVSYHRQFVDGDLSGSYAIDAFGDVQKTDTGAKRTTTKTIYFEEAYDHVLQKVEDWGELRYVCLFLSETGNDLFAYQELPEPIHPGKDGQSSIALIRAGDLTIEIGNPVSNE